MKIIEFWCEDEDFSDFGLSVAFGKGHGRQAVCLHRFLPNYHWEAFYFSGNRPTSIFSAPTKKALLAVVRNQMKKDE